MVSLPFTKMQGLGNDFIVIDDRGGGLVPLTSELAQKLCDRRFGVGADQILLLKRPMDRACDARMEILNADGSSAEMCGNGIRAVAFYLRDHGLVSKADYLIETLAGLKSVLIQGSEVEVDMGHPQLGAEFLNGGEKIEVDGQPFQFFEVEMGNPHAVIFTNALDTIALETLGPKIETHPRFSKKTNVEFVQVLSPQVIRVRVWERGAGITLACGTGACASAVASLGTEKAKSPLEVQLPGGSLLISWTGTSVKMKGPAATVFTGVYSF